MKQTFKEMTEPFCVSGSSPPRSSYKELRSRAARVPAKHLGDRDLLALIAGHHGSRDPMALADRMLTGDGLLDLCCMNASEFRDRDVSPGAAIAIAAAFELSRRLSVNRRATRPKVTSPETAAALVTDLAVLDHEELWLLVLDPRSALLNAAIIVSKGGLDSCDAEPQQILRLALGACATSFILLHNHPSGDPSPSQADISVTRRMVAAAYAVGLRLADHVIVAPGEGNWTSLRRSNPFLWTIE